MIRQHDPARTDSNALCAPGHVPDEIKEERRKRFMLLQEEISKHRLQRKLGRTLSVLVDEVGPDGAIARSSADAPEIDGVVHIAPATSLKPGTIVKVRITRADAHDLWAKLA